MDCPMTLPVYKNGQELCTLHVEKNGLYYLFTCRCTLPKGEILRVYAIDGLQVEPIGVLMPREDGFELREMISVRSWSLPNMSAAVAGFSPEKDALPWRGQIDGVSVEDGWLRPSDGGWELLVRQQTAFPLPAELAQAEPVMCGTEPCLQIRLNQAGEPVRPPQPEPVFQPEITERLWPEEPEWAPQEELPADT